MRKRTREERKSGIDGVGGEGMEHRWRNSGIGGDATERREFRAGRLDLRLEGRGQNWQGRAAKRGGVQQGGRGLCPAPPPTLSPVTASRQPALAASFPPSGAAGPAGPGRTPGTRTRPPGPAGGGIGGGRQQQGQPPWSSARRSFGS